MPKSSRNKANSSKAEKIEHVQTANSSQAQEPVGVDSVAVGVASMSPKPSRRRGPRPSPAKLERDAARVREHRAGVKQMPANDDAPDKVSDPLEPRIEVDGAPCRFVDVRKLAERERMRLRQEREQAANIVSASILTVHAPGDAVKAEGLCLDVGHTRLLEDANLVISEQTKIYGLVGPNGCGKTTLLRLLAGEYAPDYHIPRPQCWGEPYLVDQLDPEPTGRSPVEEVLSGCQERNALLEEQRILSDQLAELDKQILTSEDLSDADQRSVEKLSQQMADLDEQLARWDGAERDVSRILVGLGFRDNDDAKSADGAPSLRVKDELLIGAADLKIDEVAEVRDNADEEWLRGTVTSIEPLMVQPDGWSSSFVWTKVRHSRELSGGWRKKVNLAKALWMKPKLLLLDEPTNHLDFHALLWLEEELKEYPHTVVIVSHNACFLSEVCKKVMQVVDKRIKIIPMADLSLETLATMQRLDEKHRKFRNWRFAFPSGDRPDEHALSFHHVSFSYWPGASPVLRHVHRDVVRFHGRSRSVILGRNGSGKSTLLKLALGIVEPTDGEVHVSCEIRHFSQHFHEGLERYREHNAATYLVECCRPGLQKRFKHTDEERLRQGACEVLSWFGLDSSVAARTSVKDLSGGQKARVNFAFLSLCPAHILVLDEPTNHLDANGLDHLADALARFEGGVVLVSHDELLIRRLLASSEHSELLICSGGTIHQQSGFQGLDVYRRAAFQEQYLRAEKAAQAAELRLQVSRQRRQERQRGRRGASNSSASTREPTPDAQSCQPVPVTTMDKGITLENFFKKSKKKPKAINFNAQSN